MSGHLLISPIERMCVEAVGADAESYLHSQLSNDIRSLPIGHSCQSFVLDPNGKIVALVRVSRLLESVVLLDTDAVPGLSDLLLARLNRFKIRVDVQLSASFRTGIAVRSLEDEPIPNSTRELLAGSRTFVADAWWGDGRAVDVLPASDDEVLDIGRFGENLGVPVDGANSLEEERVRRGWPAMGCELLPGETLVAATGLAGSAVNFTKGCYPGQELVERMDSRGSSAPRTLRRIRVDDLHEAVGRSIGIDEAITIDGTEVGAITSMSGEWALIYVSRLIELGELVSSQN